jgi:hypothetical protein
VIADYTVDGSGIGANVYGSSPSSSQQWSSLNDVWDEFRVLALKVEFSRTFASGSTNYVWKPMMVVCDRNDATALNSYNTTSRFESLEMHPGASEKWSKMMAMIGVEDSGFQSTDSPSSVYWIKTYTFGNSASFTIGTVVTTYLVQFRGRGIT